MVRACMSSVTFSKAAMTGGQRIARRKGKRWSVRSQPASWRRGCTNSCWRYCVNSVDSKSNGPRPRATIFPSRFTTTVVGVPRTPNCRATSIRWSSKVGKFNPCFAMYAFTAFSPLPSIETGRMTTSLSFSASMTLCTEGFSRSQTGHQVAQNRTITTFPCSAEEWNVVPLRPGK
jgi:hypothetical protein